VDKEQHTEICGLAFGKATWGRFIDNHSIRERGAEVVFDLEPRLHRESVGEDGR